MTDWSLDSDIEEVIARLGKEAEAFAGKTVLLTGARGFLGRYFMEIFSKLTSEVLSEPVSLVALDNFIVSGTAGAKTKEQPNITFIQHDVIEPFSYDGDIDFVVHTAGIASPFYYRAYPLETLDVAVTGTRRMLDIATAKRARFTFFSSSEIYGDPDPRHVPIAESYRGNVSCQGPRACYDETKRLGETLCYVYHTREGTATNTIRPFNVYGPGMQETDYRVLPNFASRLKSGAPLNVYGSGKQTRTFCYITDAMVGFFLVILKGVPGEAYNVGNPRPEISVEDLVLSMERVLGREIPRNLVEYPDSYPADEPLRRCPDIRKARLQLGYSPEVDLDEGLRRFFRWTNEVYTGAG